jgi:hypothetical protein
MANKKEIKNKKTAKKIARTAKKLTKPVQPAGEEIETHEEEIDIIDAKGKTKKPAEIDAADILPEVDEKIVEEDAPLLATEEDEDDAVSLDEEDLNPFGDSWEE